MTRRITLDLTDLQIHVLAYMVDNHLRNIQGDGTLDDADDDALVELNDAIEYAIKELKP